MYICGTSTVTSLHDGQPAKEYNNPPSSFAASHLYVKKDNNKKLW